MIKDTPEDLRVAFLLFDSAIETLMVRKLQYLSAYLLRPEAPSYVKPEDQVLVNLDDPNQRRDEAARRDGYVHWTFSKTQVNSIDRNFEDKLRFLAWHGDIPIEYVSTISRLHDYRNEMYHREESRPQALRVVAHLYAYFVAEFLERLTPHGHSWWMGADEIAARIYARFGRAAPVSPATGFSAASTLQPAMASALKHDLDLGEAPSLIADYIADRVQHVHEMLAFSGDVAGSVYGMDYSEMDTIRFAYEPATGHASKALKPPTRALLRRWDEWAEGTRALPSALEAFHSLAGFEAEFEEFEQVVSDLAVQADLEVDRQIDAAKERRAYETE